jgi:hypothetical protein
VTPGLPFLAQAAPRSRVLVAVAHVHPAGPRSRSTVTPERVKRPLTGALGSRRAIGIARAQPSCEITTQRWPPAVNDDAHADGAAGAAAAAARAAAITATKASARRMTSRWHRPPVLSTNAGAVSVVRGPALQASSERFRC